MRSKRRDHDREFDWSRSSTDYSVYRTEYPTSLFEVLTALGIGLPQQRILDVATGTGVLARAFARRQANVTGIDISASQILEARKLVQQDGLNVTFCVSAAEDIDFENSSFEAVTVGQAWIYFDAARLIPKILRVLVQTGLLVLTHVQWLPGRDEIANKTEALVLKHNPDWTGAGYRGNIRPMLKSLAEDFDLKTFHVMNEPIEFTRESWRGRIRACRAIGATLPPQAIARFDDEHQKLLEVIAAERFTVLHQISVHVFVRKGVLIDS